MANDLVDLDMILQHGKTLQSLTIDLMIRPYLDESINVYWDQFITLMRRMIKIDWIHELNFNIDCYIYSYPVTVEHILAVRKTIMDNGYPQLRVVKISLVPYFIKSRVDPRNSQATYTLVKAIEGGSFSEVPSQKFSFEVAVKSDFFCDSGRRWGRDITVKSLTLADWEDKIE